MLLAMISFAVSAARERELVPKDRGLSQSVGPEFSFARHGVRVGEKGTARGLVLLCGHRLHNHIQCAELLQREATSPELGPLFPRRI